MKPARVAVHFQSIEDKFTPRDAIYAFSIPQDLKESALSSEIALHTAASIRSTSESHLSGITEDETDAKSEATQKPDRAEDRERKESSSSPNDAQTRHERASEILNAMRNHQRSPSQTQSLRPRRTSDTNKALPPTPAKQIRDHPVPRSIYNFDPQPSLPATDGRMSSQSARPSTRDLSSAYEYKPKVKLGPRPSIDSVGRPSSSGTNGGFRPVSALPAGLRMPVRKVVSGRPVSEQKQAPFLSTPPPRIPLPPPPPTTPNQFVRPKTPTLPNGLPSPVKTPDPKTAKMTPEKRRLMKALQLRQKQLATQKASEEVQSEDGFVEETQAECSLPREPADQPLESAHSHEQISKHSHDIDEEEDAAQARSSLTMTSLPHEPQDSPVSGPEQSEGQSTQASSLSGEDLPLHKPSHISEETIKLEDVIQDLASDENTPDKAIQSQIEDDKELSRDKTIEPDCGTSSSSLPIEGTTTLSVLKAKESSHNPVNKTTTHKRQDSSTMEFGNDGQKEDPLPVASPSEVGRRDEMKDSELEQPLQKITELRSDETQDQAYKAVPNVLPIGVPLDLQLANKTKHGYDYTVGQQSPEEADDDDLSIPIQLNLEPHEMPQPPLGESPTVVSTSSHALPDVSTTSECKSETSDAKVSESVTGHAHVDSEASQTSREILKNPELEDEVVRRYRPPATDFSSEPPNMMATMLNDDNLDTRPSTARTVTGPTKPESVDDLQAGSMSNRHSVVNALKRVSSPEQSDEQFLSDESFMEELKTVSVQEAKPISVSKSPIKPVFSRNGSEARVLEKPRATRSISSPFMDRPKDKESSSHVILPTPPSIRSFSGSNSPFLSTQSNFVPAPKKIGVSSSISQRIKALEQMSSRPTSPTLQATPQATFISLRERKSSLKSPPGTPDANGLSPGLSRPSTAYPSPATSPDVNKSDPWTRPTKPRPESVSVTATIIRDANRKSPEKPVNISEPRNMDLYQSPLIVEHKIMGPPPLSPLQPPRPQYARYPSARSGSTSSSEIRKELSPKAFRRESFASWRSGSSRNGSDLDLPRSASDKSLSSVSGLDGIKEEKKDSKRSRLLKRMSSISSMSRRSIASALSPGPKEASIIEHQEPITQAPSSVVNLGDVNVQFPDTLLWKRRHMLIDEHGLLVLSPSTSDNNTKVLTKRFPLTDFRPPYIPDQDRQELANSKNYPFNNFVISIVGADLLLQVSFLISETAAPYSVPAKPLVARWTCIIVSIL